MIAIRSPSSSASSIECVVSKIILPFLIFFINCQVKRIEYGSIPLVGSSRTITCQVNPKDSSFVQHMDVTRCHQYGSPTLLFPINAIPRDNFLFMPPERVLTILLILSARPTCLCNKSYLTYHINWIVLQVNNGSRVLVIGNFWGFHYLHKPMSSQQSTSHGPWIQVMTSHTK